MPTIADEIRTWARTNIHGAAVMTSNTDAFNHMMQAVEKLISAPWAQHEAAEHQAEVVENVTASGGGAST